MKNINKLAAVFILALAAAFASTDVFGAVVTDPKAYIESYRERNPKMPAPVKVVVPSVEWSHGEAETGKVDVLFVVDAKGKPTDISVAYASNAALAEPAIRALSGWKFAPAMRDGVPVPSKVLLPMLFAASGDD